MPLFHHLALATALLLAVPTAQAFIPTTIRPNSLFLPHGFSVPTQTLRRRYHQQEAQHYRSQSALLVSVPNNSHIDRNFYNILQVNRKANDAEIKLAYRRLAKVYHPDSNLNEDTTDKFQQLNRAYEVLSDPSLKKLYDLFGESGIGTSAASDQIHNDRRQSYSGYGGTGSRNSDSIDPDIYNTYFNQNNNVNNNGGGGGGVGTVRSDGGYGARTGLHQFVGDDVCIDFEIDFQTSILGGEAEVYVRSLVSCASCSGSGSMGADDEDGSPCTVCDGTGRTTQVTETPLGKFQSEQPCTACAGTGNASASTCQACDGKGATEKTKAIKVTIPAGVDSGSKLQVCGEGDAGPDGGPSGDLFIFLKIQADPIFRRDGRDIYADQTISCLDAIMGNTIRVPVVDGETTVELPAGTQPGHTICLKGSGSPSLIGHSNQRGNHYLTISVEIPKGVSDEEVSLVSMLKEQASVLSDPTAAAGSNDDASGTASIPQEQEAKKIQVDFKMLEDLRAKAAEAKTERSLRIDFEELASARQKEIDELNRRLSQARTQLQEETERKLHFEDLSTSQQNKLKSHKRRLDELLSHFDD